ncbi:MAG: DUF4214 domain-containing protein [Thermoanaerobaculia bacterium]
MSEETERAGSGGRSLRAILRDVAVFLLFVALTVAMTWPLAINIDRAVSDPGDPLLNTWIMNWTWHAMTTPGAEFWHAPIFHPLRYTIAFSENLLGITVFFLPLFAAGVKPLVIYNIALIAGFAFSGYAAYVLGRLITGSSAAGVVAGIFYAFMPFRFDHLPHLQHIWSGWLPLALAALIFYGRRPSWQRAALLGIALMFNGLSNGHWLLFGGVAIGFGAILLAVLCGRTFDRRFWLPLLLTLAVSHGILFAALQPYRVASELYGMKRWAGEAAAFSAEFSDWLVASRYNRFYGGNTAWSHAERCLFPGAIVLLLAAMTIFVLRRGELDVSDACVASAPEKPMDEGPRRALLRFLDTLALLAFVATCIGFADRGGDDATVETWRKAALPAVMLLLAGLARLWIAYPQAWGTGERNSLAARFRGSRIGPELQLCVLWTIVGFVGSLGMNAFFHQFLFTQLEPFRSLRVPARWSMIAYVGLAGLAAAGVVALARRVPEKRRMLATAALALVLLFELKAAPIRWYFFDTKTPPVHAWLAGAPVSGGVLELPIENQGWGEYISIFRQMSHYKPILNGISGYPTKLHSRIKTAMKEPSVYEDLLADLERAGCGIIVIHNELWDTEPKVRDWLRKGVDAGRLTFVRRFDHGAGGDWVFALTKVEKNVAALRAPEVADPAGRTPSENARIFLEENGRTYNATTFAWLDTPKFDYEVKGELVVSGWALSPHGVKDIRLVFGNGKVTLPVERFAWARLHELMPWYPDNDLPGFKAVIQTRPDGLYLDTDLQVEIVDGRGDVTALDHLFIKWHPRKKIVYTNWNEQRLPALLRSLKIGEADAKTIRAGDVAPLVAAVVGAHPQERDDDFIRAVYRTLLGRAAEDEAVGYYLTRIGRGATRRDVVEAIVASKEFRATYVAK